MNDPFQACQATFESKNVMPSPQPKGINYSLTVLTVKLPDVDSMLVTILDFM